MPLRLGTRNGMPSETLVMPWKCRAQYCPTWKYKMILNMFRCYSIYPLSTFPFNQPPPNMGMGQVLKHRKMECFKTSNEQLNSFHILKISQVVDPYPAADDWQSIGSNSRLSRLVFTLGLQKTTSHTSFFHGTLFWYWYWWFLSYFSWHFFMELYGIFGVPIRGYQLAGKRLAPRGW